MALQSSAQWEKIGDEAISFIGFGYFDTLLDASFRKTRGEDARLREAKCRNGGQSGNGACGYDLYRKRYFRRSRTVKI
jgi:hypothetical protein